MTKTLQKTSWIKSPENRTLGESILMALAYFEVFNYPLRLDEIFDFCDYRSPEIETVRKQLEELVSLGIVNRSGHYYFIGNEEEISRREQNNSYSEKLMRKALRYANIISKFPFVRSICISGSLSKKSADEAADIDYFIITEKNRVWICRTMLALFKKIFLGNSNKYFCINYFVDTDNLEIRDRNIYTATEIAFLIPVFHYENFFRFMAANSWVNAFYPRKKIEVYTLKDPEKDAVIKQVMEFALDKTIADFADNVCMKVFDLYKKIKFRYMSPETMNANLSSLKGVSKHHPNSFRNKVLGSYNEKMAAVMEIYNQKLV